MQSHVTVLEKHKRLAQVQEMDARLRVPTSEAAPLPPDCWIFQYNPDNDPHFEEDIQVGTTLTWHVGQHPTLMKPGHRVYFWRAAGKRKKPCGIVAVSILQEEPKIQRQFTHPAGGRKTFDPGDPELCASLKIERVFLETEKMLGKEVIQHDDILRQLEIVTMARQTNYPVATPQALRIAHLLKFGDVPTVHGSLRHDANMREVYGIEIDYDAGDMPPSEAVERFRKAGVAAAVLTSPSHLQPGKGQRWRGLLPLCHSDA